MSSLYVFAGRERSLLFDVGVDGTAQKDLEPYLSGTGLDPRRIRWAVISHADVDHFGGIASMREMNPDAIFVAHRLDAELISDYATYEERRARGFRRPWGLDESPEVLAWTRSVTREGPLDMAATGGERVGLGGAWELEILHVPGHSYGHLAVYDSRSRALAVADAVLGDMVPHADGRPAFPPTYRYVDSYLATISRCEALRPELLLTAHYPTMHADAAREFLARSRMFVEKLDDVVLDEVDGAGAGGLSLQELLVRANPRLGAWPREGTGGALAFPVVGHLERQLALGRIHAWQSEDGYRIRSAR
ncbi:MAG: MBL fold metallo-hydrolase [Candidatus Dormibacteraeota bacterium]|nr:MBL fold metallo-hydrolase [Candidatus Dormibacteraeota bacterium]